MTKETRQSIRARNNKRAADVDQTKEGKVRIFFGNDACCMTYKQFTTEICIKLGLSIEEMKAQLN